MIHATPEFARGALDEIIKRLVNSDDVDKEIREYSEAAAEQADEGEPHDLRDHAKCG